MDGIDSEAVEIDNFLTHGKSERKFENGKDIEDDVYIQTDRGWAWAVLAGAFLTMAINIGCHRIGGILFVEFQEKFGASSAETSLITTIINIAFCIVAPIAMTVGVKMTSCSFVVFVGAILLFLSYICTAFVEDIRLVFLTTGVLQGFGMACSEVTSVSMVTKYFDKRRGLATSVTSAGGSLGGLIIPPLLIVLFEWYEYRWSLCIFAAIVLNVCVSAAIFRHQQYHYKSSRRAQNSHEHLQAKSSLKILVNLFDCMLFRDPIFLLFQLSFGLLTSANTMSIFFLVPYAKENGISIGDIATLVIILNATDMCSRISLGFLSDFGKCRRSNIVSIYAITLCIITNFARFYDTLGLLVFFSFAVGLTGGSVFSLYAAIVADYMPMRLVDSTLGFAMLSLGSTTGIFLYVGGVLRDMTCSFIATFHLAGVLALIGGVIMASLPFVVKRKKSQQSKYITSLSSTD